MRKLKGPLLKSHFDVDFELKIIHFRAEHIRFEIYNTTHLIRWHNRRTLFLHLDAYASLKSKGISNHVPNQKGISRTKKRTTDKNLTVNLIYPLPFGP